MALKGPLFDLGKELGERLQWGREETGSEAPHISRSDQTCGFRKADIRGTHPDHPR